MSETVLVGRGRNVSKMPREVWEEGLSEAAARIGERLEFMSEEHHLVRNFVVKEMPRAAAPIPAQSISSSLKLPLTRTCEILDDLERHLFFLVRNDRGAVSWAFPVTTHDTGHHLTFSTGERLDGAWAEDAIATPFVQGRLWGSDVSVEIETSCAHCGEQIRIEVDSELRYRIIEGGSEPLVFEPDVDWSTFAAPSIIDEYWRNSLFFWSEEHARGYRAEVGQVDGIYLTLEQSAQSTRIAQSALFAFG